MDAKKIILVVDDDLINLQILYKSLSSVYSEKFFIKTVSSAKEGLQVITESISNGIQVPLIITDWLMPEMKGDEFILKVHEKYPDINTIMISGYAAPEVVEKICSKLKLKAFITKPWDINDLIAQINDCL